MDVKLFISKKLMLNFKTIQILKILVCHSNLKLMEVIFGL